MFSFLFLLRHLTFERLFAHSQFPIPAFNNIHLSTDHRWQAKQCMTGEQPLQAWSGNKRRQLKKFQVPLRICPAQKYRYLKTNLLFFVFFFLFRKMFGQHFRCIEFIDLLNFCLLRDFKTILNIVKTHSQFSLSHQIKKKGQMSNS